MVESFKHVPGLTPLPAELPLFTAQTDLVKPPPPLGVAQFPTSALPGRASSRSPHPPYRIPAKYIARFATPSRRGGSVGLSSQPKLTLSPPPNEDENGDESAEAQLIPKPVGEVGRPGRGGYNLEPTLAWAPGKYETLKVCEPHWSQRIVTETGTENRSRSR
jgi:hypothetical protein